ncbi:MAG TPA: GNAT family N-acetyltransferase [Acidimicrobiia bacterium]|nr:GNAT family N-acetyltransferase [Acidimicrobiia bacterium]
MGLDLQAADKVEDLSRMQAIASKTLAFGGARSTIHPGDLAWWVHHEDPRLADSTTYWLLNDTGFAVLAKGRDINALTVPGGDLIGLIERIRQLDDTAEVGSVSEADTELVTHLVASGFEPASYLLNFELNLPETEVPPPGLGPGWELRHVRGEAEANDRSSASHRAFESTLDPPAQLNRYLRFMRSPVYDRERDLVAVAPDGRIAAFMVWWSDPSGIAQIEPFGTHPDFQRQGVGRALITFGLERMRAAGMRTVRVCTDESRERAVSFYSSLGFRQGPRLGSWRSP